MLDQGQLIEIEEAAMRGKTFSSDVVLALIEIIAELEENATAQALALKAAKAMQQAETERADANQAKIDALMFEYCPDEMTDEQRHKWAVSQAMSNL